MLTLFYEYVILILEVIGVSIIIIGIAKMVVMFATCLVRHLQISHLITEIRIELSNYLILCLEVFIGRDIIETLLDPGLNDIIILVVLVFLRTLLAFFLNYEMTHAQKKELHKVFQKKGN
ncbi:DUF1622 domain-containing protein [Patescibacteria group bacterium]